MKEKLKNYFSGSHSELMDTDNFIVVIGKNYKVRGTCFIGIIRQI